MPNLVCCPVCLQYLPAHPVLRLREADMLCDYCFQFAEDKGTAIPVKQSVLLAARHVIYVDMERLFLFRLKGESAGEFYAYAEQYLLNRLRMFFPTLKFFRELNGPETEQDFILPE